MSLNSCKRHEEVIARQLAAENASIELYPHDKVRGSGEGTERHKHPLLPLVWRNKGSYLPLSKCNSVLSELYCDAAKSNKAFF